MNTNEKLIDQYYDGLSNNKEIDRNIFADGFTFIGPLKTYHSAEEFISEMKQMAMGITGINVKAKFSNQENRACIIADLMTIAPLNTTTPYAELFTFEDGKIKSIQLFYDAREWAAVMNG